MAENKSHAPPIFDVLFDADLDDFSPESPESDSDNGWRLNFHLLVQLYSNREQIKAVSSKARVLQRKWDSVRSSTSLISPESSLSSNLKLADAVLQKLIDNWDSDIGPMVQLTHENWDGIVRFLLFLKKFAPVLKYVHAFKALDVNMKRQSTIFLQNVSNSFCGERIKYTPHHRTSIRWPFSYMPYVKPSSISGQQFRNGI